MDNDYGSGSNNSTPQSNYPQTNQQQSGYPQTGYQQNGYPQTNYQQGSYPQTGYQQNGYPQNGYQQYPQTNYYQQNGYPQNGYRQYNYQQPYYQQYQQYPYQQQGESAANAALICGIISLFIAGLILGIIAVVQASNAKKQGYIGGKATAGMVTGIIGIAGSVFTGLMCIALI